MVNELLMNWIRENNARGYSLDSIRQVLSQQGYASEDIEEAMGALGPVAEAPTAAAPPAKNTEAATSWKSKYLKNRKIMLPVTVILILLIVLGISFLIPLNRPASTEGQIAAAPQMNNTAAGGTGTRANAPSNDQEALNKALIREIIKSGVETSLMGKNILAQLSPMREGASFNVNGETFFLGLGESKTLADGSIITFLGIIVSSDLSPDSLSIELTMT